MIGSSVLVALGSASALPHDLALDLGDHHPAQHGPWQLALRVDDGVIAAAEARIGFMHRSAEKLFEVRDYRQVLSLANRHDWINPLTSELGVALAIENAMGLVAPERATWSRMLLAELTRAATALVFVGAAVPDVVALQHREAFLTLLEQATGSRVHPMFVRIGGIATPFTSEWLDDCAAWIDAVGDDLPAIASRSEDRWLPLTGVARIDAAQVSSFGATGPIARSTGVSLDLRRDRPNLFYAEVADLLPASINAAGDIPARYATVIGEVPSSVAIARHCIHRLRALGEGPVNVRLPKVVRVPPGTTYSQFEGPLGISGYLLDSLGDKVPSRLKLRTPAFAAVQALTSALPGTPMSHLADAVMSFFIVIGDADR